MRAKFVYESIGDILKPKSEKEISNLLKNLPEEDLYKESLNEGTWNLPKYSDKSYIEELEIFQKEIFDIFGDDELHDNLDKAIDRMKKLVDFNTNKRISLKSI